MRKRNAVLSWITGIMIVILVLLLFSSFALIWGRVFAPSMPDSSITRIWKWIRDGNFAKGIMRWLRGLPCYEACCNAARDSEGNMEPLKYILELMGCVSFMLGAINEVKSSRSFGMLMDDVIYYVFPFHLIIQAPLYALFAVTGCYACLKNVGIAVAFCFLGIKICFIYSLIMACCLFVSSTAKEGLVTFYIKGVISSKLCRSEKIDDWRKTAGECVLNYAKYIGQQWTQGNILQIQRNNKWAREELLINLATFELTADTSCLHEQLTPNSVAIELRVAKDFEKIFPDSVPYQKENARHVLFTKAIPFMYDKDCETFELDIRRCSQIWEQLFSQLENEKRKAQMAYAVLWEARASDWHVFTLMSMGLLEYLGVAKCNFADSNIMQSIEKKISFLHNVRMSASETIPEENLSNRYDFDDNWAEIIYLTAGILQWMLAMNCIPEGDGDALVQDLLKAIQVSMSDERFVCLKRNSEKYVVLSYLLFAYDNVDVRKEMSAYVTQFLVPEVCTRLNSFDAK